MASRSRHRGRKPRVLRESRKVSVSRSAQGNVRESAAWVVERTLATASPADSFLEGARQRSDPRDHGLLLELVRGTLTWLRRIDHVLSVAAKRPLDRIEDALLPVLRVATYQLLFMDRIPKHAVVNEAVEQAHGVTHRGGVSFTNGVLRGIARSPGLEHWPVEIDDPVARLGTEFSHPDLLVERWLDRFGSDTTKSLMEANNRRRQPHLLAFKSRGGRELLAERLIDLDVEVVASDIAPLGLRVGVGVPKIVRSEPFREGLCYVQDEASQVAALVPPPRPGERILDLAAAPGGKLFAAASFQPDSVHVGSDVSLQRLQRLRENAERLGLAPSLLVADAAQPPFGSQFDRVVVDAPCSGTGTLRKNPELRWRVSANEIDRLAREGRSLLQGAGRAVRPGGLLVWITCSLEREENEDVAEWFLERETQFVAADFEQELPACLQPWIQGAGSWRMLTAGDHDGFSVQAFRRRGEGAE